MKLWLALPALPPGQELRDYVVAARQAGAEGITVSEHIIVPATVGKYPYSGEQAQIPLGTQFPDLVALVADLAAHVESIRFMTNMLIAPLQHPLILARQVATLAALTGGRFDLGIGAGWMREEFDAVGVPFEERGARMNEIIALLPQLWSADVVEHEGKCFQFDKVQTPTPPCTVPIYVGGNSEFALRRAAKAADGWSGVGLYEFQIEEVLKQLADIASEHRDPERKPLQIRTLLKGRIDPARLAAHARLGVDALVLQNWQVTGEKPFAKQTAAEVGEKLAELTAICSQLSANEK
ncbi:MAG: TIGR03619 family F420-dependent LLM class oxidoreductase [Parasphingorhabdus sp.]|nr:TIGR03619 family F420-dependent LLM class oxidoreductase [Parasphingorhabdus sp.]